MQIKSSLNGWEGDVYFDQDTLKIELATNKQKSEAVISSKDSQL